MATDGVKIIDGDTAFDIYGSFIDAYNNGADGATLRAMYEQDKQLYCFDDCESEICVTVYALALWEVGEITPEIIREVEAVIAKGAGVEDWTEQINEKAGKARNKELAKLWAKINAPNPKILKRKNYAKIKNPVFNIGDVLAFQLPNGTYGATIVVDITQYRGKCDYMLCRTTFNSTKKPTTENIGELRVVGSFVPTGGGGFSPELMEKIQKFTAEEIKHGAIDGLTAELTSSMPKLKMPWVMAIQHNNLKAKDYADNFEKIDNIRLRSNCGSSRFAPDYKSFYEEFYIQDTERDYQSSHMPEMGEFTVSELCAQPYQGE